MTDQNQQQPKGTVLLSQRNPHATLTPVAGPAASHHTWLHGQVLTIR